MGQIYHTIEDGELASQPLLAHWNWYLPDELAPQLRRDDDDDDNYCFPSNEYLIYQNGHLFFLIRMSWAN